MINFSGYYYDKQDEFNSLVYGSYKALLSDFHKYGHDFILGKYYNFILDNHKKLTKEEIKNEFVVFKKLMHIERSIVFDFMMLEMTAKTKFYKIYENVFGEIKEPDIEILDNGEIDIS